MNKLWKFKGSSVPGEAKKVYRSRWTRSVWLSAAFRWVVSTQPVREANSYILPHKDWSRVSGAGPGNWRVKLFRWSWSKLESEKYCPGLPYSKSPLLPQTHSDTDCFLTHSPCPLWAGCALLQDPGWPTQPPPSRTLPLILAEGNENMENCDLALKASAQHCHCSFHWPTSAIDRVGKYTFFSEQGNRCL